MSRSNTRQIDLLIQSKKLGLVERQHSRAWNTKPHGRQFIIRFAQRAPVSLPKCPLIQINPSPQMMLIIIVYTQRTTPAANPNPQTLVAGAF